MKQHQDDIAQQVASALPWHSMGVRRICDGVFQSIPDLDEEADPRTQLVIITDWAPLSDVAVQAARLCHFIDPWPVDDQHLMVWTADEQESVGALLMSSQLVRDAFEQVTGHQVYEPERIRRLLVDLGSVFPETLDRLVDAEVAKMMGRAA